MKSCFGLRYDEITVLYEFQEREHYSPYTATPENASSRSKTSTYSNNNATKYESSVSTNNTLTMIQSPWSSHSWTDSFTLKSPVFYTPKSPTSCTPKSPASYTPNTYTFTSSTQESEGNFEERTSERSMSTTSESPLTSESSLTYTEESPSSYPSQICKYFPKYQKKFNRGTDGSITATTLFPATSTSYGMSSRFRNTNSSTTLTVLNSQASTFSSLLHRVYSRSLHSTTNSSSWTDYTDTRSSSFGKLLESEMLHVKYPWSPPTASCSDSTTYPTTKSISEPKVPPVLKKDQKDIMNALNYILLSTKQDFLPVLDWILVKYAHASNFAPELIDAAV